MSFFINSEFFAQIIGYATKPAVIVMKYYPIGSLDQLLQNGGHSLIPSFQWNDDVIRIFAKQIIKAISMMHEQGLIHDDIKPQNILIDRKPNGALFCLLSDFGTARIISDNLMLVRAFKKVQVEAVSLQYSAPEILFDPNRNQDPNILKAGDIYSFSMVLFSMLTRKLPWGYTNKEDILEKLRKREVPELPVELFQMNDNIDKMLQVMMRGWVYEPLNRPTAAEISKMLSE